MWIKIGITEVGGNKHEIIVDAETIDDYSMCKRLLRELWLQGIIEDYVMALVKER